MSNNVLKPKSIMRTILQIWIGFNKTTSSWCITRTLRFADWSPLLETCQNHWIMHYCPPRSCRQFHVAWNDSNRQRKWSLITGSQQVCWKSIRRGGFLWSKHLQRTILVELQLAEIFVSCSFVELKDFRCSTTLPYSITSRSNWRLCTPRPCGFRYSFKALSRRDSDNFSSEAGSLRSNNWLGSAENAARRVAAKNKSFSQEMSIT